jgi:hypothetical protein
MFITGRYSYVTRTRLVSQRIGILLLTPKTLSFIFFCASNEHHSTTAAGGGIRAEMLFFPDVAPAKTRLAAQAVARNAGKENSVPRTQTIGDHRPNDKVLIQSQSRDSFILCFFPDGPLPAEQAQENIERLKTSLRQTNPTEAPPSGWY